MGSSSSGIAQKIVSWFAVTLGIGLGMVMLTALGRSEIDAHAPIVVTTTLVIGLAPILASFFATRNPRWAARILLGVSPFALLLLMRFALGFHLAMTVVLGATVIPGLFWLFASRRNWPLLLKTTDLPHRLGFRILLVFGLCFTLLASSVFFSLLLPFWPPIGDCGGGPLLNEQGAPRNIDFTAKILFIGPRSFRGWSLWSVARVEERFSVVPSTFAGLVVLRDFFRSTNKFEHVFIEGQRSRALFTHFLPVIERVECGHSKRLSDATDSLRILHDGAPRTGVRIIGRVYTSWREHSAPVPRIEVLIRGPEGSTVTLTDTDGIYDVTGLPSGQYTIELSTTKMHPKCAVNLERVAVDGCTLFLDEVHGPPN